MVKQPTAIRRVIGLAGQNAAVDDTFTGRENLEMIGRLSRLVEGGPRTRAGSARPRVAARCRRSSAQDVLRWYAPAGIDLGAGLVAHPRVLLLDEPTTGLDPANRIDLWAYLRDLVDEGASILLTTQYLEEADQLASQIVVIDHGTRHRVTARRSS